MSSQNTSNNMALSGRQLGLMFVLFMIGHSVIIYLASKFFPQQVVLGNHILSSNLALFFSMTIVTLVTVGAAPLIEWKAEYFKKKLTPQTWMLIYLLVNFVALKLAAVWAKNLGMGLSSWVVALVLAVLFTLVQGFMMKFVMENK